MKERTHKKGQRTKVVIIIWASRERGKRGKHYLSDNLYVSAFQLYADCLSASPCGESLSKIDSSLENSLLQLKFYTVTFCIQKCILPHRRDKIQRVSIKRPFCTSCHPPGQYSCQRREPLHCCMVFILFKVSQNLIFRSS